LWKLLRRKGEDKWRNLCGLGSKIRLWFKISFVVSSVDFVFKKTAYPHIVQWTVFLNCHVATKLRHDNDGKRCTTSG